MRHMIKIMAAMALMASLLLPVFAMAQSSRPDSLAVCLPGKPDTVMNENHASATVARLMGVEEIAVAVDSLSANYDSDWTELSMQGKLSFTGLPMRVSVKVYMHRGNSIILSARAPFLGEVARVEMCQDSITFINKHSRTYNTQSLAGLVADPQAYLCDIQDILLGQVAFPGHGRMTRDLSKGARWIALSESDAFIYPFDEFQISGTEYGFIMDSSCWQLYNFVMLLQNAGVVVQTTYQYDEDDWMLGLDIDLGKKRLKGEVQLSYPDYAPTPLEFTSVGSKYRRVDMKELMRF